MRLHCDPISTTTRPVLLFLAEHEVPVETVFVNLLQGEHLSDEFARINPNRAVPVLVDGDFVLTECSAILKYLAEVYGSTSYPTATQARAQVNAMMDWFNTGLSEDLNHAYVYPQIFPSHAFANPVTQADVLARGLQGAGKRLAVLDQRLQGQPFVCGQELTLADYIGAAYIGLSEAIAFDLSGWPAVEAWMDRMRARPSWREAHAAFYGLLAAHRQTAAAQ